MENKRINIVFYIIVIFFFAVFAILIVELNAKRAVDYRQYVASISNVIQEKNNKIRILYQLLLSKEKENEDLKNTLAETRNDLDALSKKLAVPEINPLPAAKS